MFFYIFVIILFVMPLNISVKIVDVEKYWFMCINQLKTIPIGCDVDKSGLEIYLSKIQPMAILTCYKTCNKKEIPENIDILFLDF